MSGRRFEVPRIGDIDSDLLEVSDLEGVPGGLRLHWTGHSHTATVWADPAARSVTVRVRGGGIDLDVYREGATAMSVRETGPIVVIDISVDTDGQTGSLTVELGEQVSIRDRTFFA